MLPLLFCGFVMGFVNKIEAVDNFNFDESSSKDPNFCVVLGARSEIVKLSGIIKYLEATNKSFFIVHTNQHYSEKLDAVFFQELELIKPKYNLGVGSGRPGAQTGRILALIEDVLIQENPDIVIVHGDTNSALAGALAGGKLNIPVAHVEAGLRSFDRKTSEELNRVLIDQISTCLFAPAAETKLNLLREGISDDKIIITGNTIVDAMFQNIQKAEKTSGILLQLGLQRDDYILLTTHRTENTQCRRNINGIVLGAFLVSQYLHKRIIFPVHPKTKKALQNFDVVVPENISLTEPMGFFDFLVLEKNAHLILTDSGGVQEESCILRVPCVSLRDNTERPETLDAGANVLAGTNHFNILQKSMKMSGKMRDWENPFGDGKSSEHIVDYLWKL